MRTNGEEAKLGGFPFVFEFRKIIFVPPEGEYTRED